MAEVSPPHLPWPADALKIKRADILDGGLWTMQNEAEARLDIAIRDELATIIEMSINQWPDKHLSGESRHVAPNQR